MTLGTMPAGPASKDDQKLKPDEPTIAEYIKIMHQITSPQQSFDPIAGKLIGRDLQLNHH